MGEAIQPEGGRPRQAPRIWGRINIQNISAESRKIFQSQMRLNSPHDAPSSLLHDRGAFWERDRGKWERKVSEPRLPQGTPAAFQSRRASVCRQRAIGDSYFFLNPHFHPENRPLLHGGDLHFPPKPGEFGGETMQEAGVTVFPFSLCITGDELTRLTSR